MSVKKITFLILVILLPATYVRAQADSFCVAIHALLKDAGNKFILSKGPMTEADEKTNKWECNTHVPGAINARVVSAMGLFYEGALFQTKDINAIDSVYNAYKTQLSTCLSDQYKLTATDNFNKGLEHYKKLIFMKPDDNMETPPPHVTMEVDYYKPAGIYTILLYIWEH